MDAKVYLNAMDVRLSGLFAAHGLKHNWAVSRTASVLNVAVLFSLSSIMEAFASGLDPMMTADMVYAAYFKMDGVPAPSDKQRRLDLAFAARG